MSNEFAVTLDAKALELEQDIARFEAAVIATRQRLELLKAQVVAAQDDEGTAMEKVGALQAVAAPLLLQTRDGPNQGAIYIGDTMWRARFPAASEAHGRLESARQEASRASARTTTLSKQREEVEYGVLPGLEAALRDKQEALEQHRASQAAMLEAKLGADGHQGWRQKLDDFRGRLGGASSEAQG